MNKLLPLIAFSILLLVPVGSQNAFSQVIIFQDDYSSNAGWTQVGTDVTVDSVAFPGIVKFDNARDGGGVNEKRVFKQLPSALPADQWSADFDYKFTASNIPGHFPFAFSATSADITFQSDSDRVLVRHGGSGLNQMQLGAGGLALPGAIPISANTQYFVTLERVPTQLILSVFSDPARTIHIPNSPFVQTIAITDFTNINFIQHTTGLNGGPARTLTAELDNTIIFTTPQESPAPEESLEDTSVDLETIINDNLGTPLADKLEDANAKVETTITELNKTPPDNQAAVGNIEGAVGDIQAAVDAGDLDAATGTQLMDDLAEIARQITVDAIDTAIATPGSDPVEIADAQQFLADGDALLADSLFKDAVAKYKDALAKAESALP